MDFCNFYPFFFAGFFFFFFHIYVSITDVFQLKKLLRDKARQHTPAPSFDKAEMRRSATAQKIVKQRLLCSLLLSPPYGESATILNVTLRGFR